jgi:hypothetical protein
MAQEPVFDIQRCEVSPVFPIPPGGWFADPSVPQAPQEIDDCLDVPIAVPDPDVPCPSLQVAPQGVQARIVPSGQERVELRIVRGDCCDCDFSLQNH